MVIQSGVNEIRNDFMPGLAKSTGLFYAPKQKTPIRNEPGPKSSYMNRDLK